MTDSGYHYNNPPTPPTLDVTTNNYSDATPTTRLHIRLLGCTFDYLAAPTDYLAAVNDNPAVGSYIGTMRSGKHAPES